jgi:sporulation protein YlmC with PRC-barrel domain
MTRHKSATTIVLTNGIFIGTVSNLQIIAKLQPLKFMLE